MLGRVGGPLKEELSLAGGRFACFWQGTHWVSSGVVSWHVLAESPQILCKQSKEWSFCCWCSAVYAQVKEVMISVVKNCGVLLRQ